MWMTQGAARLFRGTFGSRNTDGTVLQSQAVRVRNAGKWGGGSIYGTVFVAAVPTTANCLSRKKIALESTAPGLRIEATHTQTPDIACRRP